MPRPKLTLGIIANSFPLWRQRYTLNHEQLQAHFHVLGVSGTGKSKFLESIWLQLFRQGVGVSFIDPHADSVNALLGYLTQLGHFKRPEAFRKLLYVEFREDDWFLPLNILKQQAMPHTIAGNFREALHRAWPALSMGAAPMFDTLVQDGVKVLVSNNLPVTSLYKLLTDTEFRDSLLEHEQDLDVVAFFHDQFDRLSPKDQADQAGAALRRAHLLTFSPVLKYSLGQTENVLDVARIMDQGISVLYNLGGVQDQEARRLLGCLLNISYEQAALSREGTGRPRTQHHLIIDEMGEFVSQSEQGLSRMLSQSRKYGLFAILAHQTWSQATARLRGALQNAQLEVAFGIGRDDAEEMAKLMGRVDTEAVKAEPLTERSQPIWSPIQEQWEQQVQELIDLPARHAMVHVRTKETVEIVTLNMPPVKTRPEQVEEIKAEYRQRLMRRKEDIVLPHQQREELYAQRTQRSR